MITYTIDNEEQPPRPPRWKSHWLVVILPEIIVLTLGTWVARTTREAGHEVYGVYLLIVFCAVVMVFAHDQGVRNEIARFGTKLRWSIDWATPLTLCSCGRRHIPADGPSWWNCAWRAEYAKQISAVIYEGFIHPETHPEIATVEEFRRLAP